jgi:hypothetical protein
MPNGFRKRGLNDSKHAGEEAHGLPPFFYFKERRRMMKIYGSFILCLCLAAVVLVSPVSSSEERFNVPLDNSPSLGPKDAPVTMIEFLDYQ